jgi:hypothetical protein
MKIFVICSKHFYHKLAPTISQLESQGHIIMPPNHYHDPFKEEEMKKLGAEEHAKWKGDRIKEQTQKVQENDAVLVMNYDKGDQKNYIGGATFLEINKAFEFNKKIFFYNELPESIFLDELKAFNPKVINQDLNKIN